MIETKYLAKIFGKKIAVKALTLTVGRGEVYGFIGPNGAGKTTTIRMLATLLRPDGGDATIAGHSLTEDPIAVRRAVGFMPDRTPLYEELTVEDYLRFFASAHDLPPARWQTTIDAVVELMGLRDWRGTACAELSLGWRQRLGLARALLHEPQVLLLDEPASGLDPMARIELREVIRELARMGKTIFLSSHILPELEQVCDRVGILREGELVWQGRPGEAPPGATQRVRVTVAGDATAAKAALAALREVKEVSERAPWLVVELAAGVRDTGAIARALVSAGIDPVEIVVERPSLEDLFLGVVGAPPPTAG